MQVISFDLHARFGFFKKPDINEGVYLTYNMMHKPALLGVLGAIVGLEGYQEPGEIPEYYHTFKDLKVGVSPIKSQQGVFPKTIIQYNNSVGYASKETGGNWIVAEQTLINPGYRCFVGWEESTDIIQALVDKLQAHESDFIPYMGKNDHSAWWNNVQLYNDVEEFTKTEEFSVDTLFQLPENQRVSSFISMPDDRWDDDESDPGFHFHEKLPVHINQEIRRYELASFTLTNASFKPEAPIQLLFKVENSNHAAVIQLH